MSDEAEAEAEARVSCRFLCRPVPACQKQVSRGDMLLMFCTLASSQQLKAKFGNLPNKNALAKRHLNGNRQKDRKCVQRA